jgi:hypothetical protein
MLPHTNHTKKGLAEMGKDKQEEARKKPLSWRKRGKTEGTADWQQCDAELVKRAIVAAGMCGSALRFGYSQDGGAYAIGIYHNEQRTTEFIRPSEDIDEVLQDLIDFFESERDGQQPATMPKTASTSSNGYHKP